MDLITGFWMRNRNCRAPDISFVSKVRLKGLKRAAKKFFEGLQTWRLKFCPLPTLRKNLLTDYAIFLAAEQNSPGSFILKNSSSESAVRQQNEEFSALERI